MLKIVADPSPISELDPRLAPFAGISYRQESAFRQAREQLQGRRYPRCEVSEIVDSYNRSIGNDSAALANIKALAQNGSTCVITGQQLGLMGGPSYTILKGITCLAVARSVGAVPIFWLATEDHDISEIDHTFLLDRLGNLKRFRLAMRGKHIAVENLKLTSRHLEEIAAFWKELGMPPPTGMQAGESYAAAMARLLVHLFAGTGLVFFEPRLLRPLSIPLFKKEITDCKAIADVLTETTQKLVAAGGKAPIAVDKGPNLFLFSTQGKRMRLTREGNYFAAGEESFGLNELLTLVDTHPERFSMNVASRPVLQSALLPTIAYVGGPSEREYYLQLGDYHRYHDVLLPCFVPRLSATLLPPAIAALLEGCRLDPWSEIPLHWTDPQPDGIPANALHILRNWLHPHQQRQERILNWWSFQAGSKGNLIAEILESLPPITDNHQYIYYA